MNDTYVFFLVHHPNEELLERSSAVGVHVGYDLQHVVERSVGVSHLVGQVLEIELRIIERVRGVKLRVGDGY